MTDTEILDRLLAHIKNMEEVRDNGIAHGYTVEEYWRGYDHAQATFKNYITYGRRGAL